MNSDQTERLIAVLERLAERLAPEPFKQYQPYPNGGLRYVSPWPQFQNGYVAPIGSAHIGLN